MMAEINDTRVKVPANILVNETTSPYDETNDVDSSNPSGRVPIDSGRVNKKPNFLKCKKTVNIGTMNTRSLRSPHKQLELCVLAQRYNNDVIGIQEHRMVHNDNSDVQFENLTDGYQLVTQSAWRNTSGAAVGGVGVLLSPFARKVLVSVCYVSPRIMKVTLNGNNQTTILVTYAPTNVADEEETINFYNSLIEITREIPAHNFLTVIGDFNARVGRNSAKIYIS